MHRRVFLAVLLGALGPVVAVSVLVRGTDPEVAAAVPAPAKAAFRSQPPPPPTPPPTPSRAARRVDPPAADLALAVLAADVVSPAQGVRPLVEPTLGEATRIVHDFLHVTSTLPLTGRPGAGLSGVATDDAAGRAAVEDRAVVFDEGLATSPTLRPSEATVAFRALAGQGGGLELIVATVVWDVQGAAHVRRTGELTLVATPGGWRVGAYDLEVVRG